VLDFRFHAIQLNQLNWRDFLRHRNPVASALMSRMRIEPKDRPRVKLECLRMLATLRLDRARASLISTFMDAYLKLTPSEVRVYNRQLQSIEPKEREVVMELTNEWIRLGKKDGLKQGRLEGRREMVIRQLRKRLGTLPAELIKRVGRLSDSKVDDLGEALLDFHNVADAKNWLSSTAKV
jgi:predicted transposase YdaD